MIGVRGNDHGGADFLGLLLYLAVARVGSSSGVSRIPNYLVTLSNERAKDGVYIGCAVSVYPGLAHSTSFLRHPGVLNIVSGNRSPFRAPCQGYPRKDR